MNLDFRKTFNTSTVLAALLLAGGILAMQTAASALSLAFIKQPLPLRFPLSSIPAQFGTYQMVSDSRLSSDVEQELGTDKYIIRMYRNTALPPTDNGSMYRLHIAYYTGTPDTVPHVPERCFVGAGVQPSAILNVSVPLDQTALRPLPDGSLAGYDTLGRPITLPHPAVPLRLFQFAASNSDRTQCVGYFFMVNGTYDDSPDKIRLRVLDLTVRHAYWCKIEVFPGRGASPQDFSGIDDPKAAADAIGQFLSAALPQIASCLPDWDAAEGKKKPTNR